MLDLPRGHNIQPGPVRNVLIVNKLPADTVICTVKRLKTKAPVQGRRDIQSGTVVVGVGRPGVIVAEYVAFVVVYPGAGILDGTVLDTYFLGGTSTVAIRVSGVPAPFICTLRSVHVPMRGSEIGLIVDAARTVAVADDRGAASLEAVAQETVSS